MHSTKKLYRYLGIRQNPTNKVFHTALRASDESNFVVINNGTQFHFVTSPDKIYNIMAEGDDLKQLKDIKSHLSTIYIGHGFIKAPAHHDTRLDK